MVNKTCIYNTVNLFQIKLNYNYSDHYSSKRVLSAELGNKAEKAYIKKLYSFFFQTDTCNIINFLGLYKILIKIYKSLLCVDEFMYLLMVYITWLFC